RVFEDIGGGFEGVVVVVLVEGMGVGGGGVCGGRCRGKFGGAAVLGGLFVGVGDFEESGFVVHAGGEEHADGEVVGGAVSGVDGDGGQAGDAGEDTVGFGAGGAGGAECVGGVHEGVEFEFVHDGFDVVLVFAVGGAAGFEVGGERAGGKAGAFQAVAFAGPDVFGEQFGFAEGV